MIKAPCKDCPDRHLECHGSCPKYQEFKELTERIRDERMERQEKYQDLYGYKEAKVRRLKK